MAAPTSPLSLLRLAHLSDCYTLTLEDLAVAERLVSEFLRRPLWLPADGDDPWVEELTVYPLPPPIITFDPVIAPLGDPFAVGDPFGWGAVVYPSATPVVSTSLPHAQLRDPQSLIVPANIDTVIQVPYKGGWTADTVPETVVDVIAQLAAANSPYTTQDEQLDPELLALIGAGATSVRLGDAAVTFGAANVTGRGGSGVLARMDQMVPGSSQQLRPYRKGRAA